MTKNQPPPLSETVTAVFDQFLKKLQEDNVIGEVAQQALTENLHAQKLDHETIRKALFKPDDPPK